MTTSADPRRRHGLVYWLPVLVVAALVLGYGAFAGLAWWITADAYERGRATMREFPGDEVDALAALVGSEGRSLAERNRAVHALGQIADKRALPTLERYYTGAPCNHSRHLCQYELKKAIGRCRGERQPPGWFPFMPRRPADGPGMR